MNEITKTTGRMARATPAIGAALGVIGAVSLVLLSLVAQFSTPRSSSAPRIEPVAPAPGAAEAIVLQPPATLFTPAVGSPETTPLTPSGPLLAAAGNGDLGGSTVDSATDEAEAEDDDGGGLAAGEPEDDEADDDGDDDGPGLAAGEPEDDEADDDGDDDGRGLAADEGDGDADGDDDTRLLAAADGTGRGDYVTGAWRGTGAAAGERARTAKRAGKGRSKHRGKGDDERRGKRRGPPATVPQGPKKHPQGSAAARAGRDPQPRHGEDYDKGHGHGGKKGRGKRR